MASQRLWAAAVVAATLVAVASRVDERPAAAYGFARSRGWWADLVGGALLGALLVASVYAVAIARGRVAVVEVASAGDAGAFLPWMALLLLSWGCVAFWEETLFRGVFITNAREGLAARGLDARLSLLGAWTASTAVFALVHVPASNVPADVSLGSLFVVWTVLGGLLGVAYVVSGGLAVPIGIHFAVNAVSNTVFGPATAGTLPPALLRVAGGYHPMSDPVLVVPAAALAGVVLVAWLGRPATGSSATGEAF